jgi:hypothetical protein
MCSFWAGGISSFPFSRAREYRLLRRLSEMNPLVHGRKRENQRYESYQGSNNNFERFVNCQQYNDYLEYN